MPNDDKTIRQLSDFAHKSGNHYDPILSRINDDLKFAGGDQHQDYDKTVRGDNRVKFTFNFVRNYCNQILNKYKESPYAAAFSGRSSDTADKAAFVQGLVRGIESRANFSKAQAVAFDRAVKGGRGYMVLSTDYSSESGWDQDFVISAIHNPSMVIWDPLSKDVAGDDAVECAVIEHKDIRVARSEYGFDMDMWEGKNSPLFGTQWQAPEGSIECVTYYRLERTKSKLYKGPNGESLTEDKVRKNSRLPFRHTTSTKVKVYKIIGDTVVAETEAPLSRLPVFPVLGEMIDTDNGLDFVGITHFSRDPQRLINWMQSLIGERISIEPKPTTYVDMQSIIKYKDVWQASNKVNFPFLPFDSKDSKGNPLQGPTDRDVQAQLSDVTSSSANFQQALSDILGIPVSGGNIEADAKTAVEVLTRSKSADRANYQYFENLAESVKALSKVMLQWLGVIYDTERRLPIETEEGVESTYANVSTMNIIPDEYDVDVDAGPMFSTNRKENLQGLITIGGLLGPEGMLLVAPDAIENSDLPNSKKIAESVRLYAQKTLGITPDSVDMAPDPEAEEALMAAEEAVSSLEQTVQAKDAQIQNMFNYIQQLQQEVQNNETKIAADIAKEEIKAQNRLELEVVKSENSLTEKQMDIVNDQQKETMKAIADIEKAKEANKPTIDIELSAKPDMPSVGGLRNDIL